MTRRNYLVLLLLALLFAAPGITAYLYYLNPQWLGANTTNKGKLLNPPLLLSNVVDGRGKWRFVLWYPRNCDAKCLQKVDKLARVRLALGRYLYEVDQWLLLNEDSQQMESMALKTLQEQEVHVSRLSKDSLTNLPILASNPKIFIANPKGYLVLAYVENAKPGDIYHDIKRLLSTEKSG